eukprot:1408387-Prymnesium_polylepis.1
MATSSPPHLIPTLPCTSALGAQLYLRPAQGAATAIWRAGVRTAQQALRLSRGDDLSARRLHMHERERRHRVLCARNSQILRNPPHTAPS